jgi:hypothetical protein
VLFFGFSAWANLSRGTPIAWTTVISVVATGVLAGLLESGAMRVLIGRASHNRQNAISSAETRKSRDWVLSKILLTIVLIAVITVGVTRDGWRSTFTTGSVASIGIHALLFSYFLSGFLGCLLSAQYLKKSGAQPAA